MKTYLVLVFLLSLNSQIFGVRIYCEYKYIAWPVIGNSYSCLVRNFNLTQPDDSIVKVSGEHLPRLNHNQIKALEIRGQNCHFLPQRIKNFFPNLELLRVVNSRLKVISQNDLKTLTKLRVLQMNGNHLTNLDSDLFDSNLDLVRIDFRSQKLKIIGYNIFDKLEKLALADFQYGGCVNFMAHNGKTGIAELKKEIRINCQPIDDFFHEIKALKEKIELLESSHKQAKVQSLSFETDAAFVKLNAKFIKLQNDNEKCLATSEVLTKNFHAIIDKVDTVQRALKLKENDSCALNDIASQKCLIENEKLIRFKRELSLIDIECEKVEWIKSNKKIQSCNLKNLKIYHEDFEIKNVVAGHRGQLFDGSSIEELKAFNEQVPYLPVNIAEKFSNLKMLTFIDCGLTFVNTKVLENMGKLQNLSLSRNLIKGISAHGFKNLNSLIDLDLSYNKLEKVQANAFDFLNELLVLKLNNNLLVELSEKTFFNLKKLKFLFLQKNTLSTISPTLLESLRKLEMADFKDNSCVNLEVTRESAITIRSMKTYFGENCWLEELRQL